MGPLYFDPTVIIIYSSQPHNSKFKVRVWGKQNCSIFCKHIQPIKVDIQWGSEILTSLDFERLKWGWVAKSLDFKIWKPNHMKSGKMAAILSKIIWNSDNVPILNGPVIFCPRHSSACAYAYFSMVKYHGKIGMSHHICAYDKSLLV